MKISNIFKEITCLITLCSFFSCSKIYEKKVTGVYEKDKFVYRDSYNDSIFIEDKSPLLVLYADKTFELKQYDEVIYITGKWKILKRGNRKVNSRIKGLLIEFDYNGKKTEGLLSERIFYFDYPNDFHSGKYATILYTRTAKSAVKSKKTG